MTCCYILKKLNSSRSIDMPSKGTKSKKKHDSGRKSLDRKRSTSSQSIGNNYGEESAAIMNGGLDVNDKWWPSSEEDIPMEIKEAKCDGSGTEFSKSYDQNVRPFIDLIDKLRSHGLDADIQLPAIAVIGDQSAGKSSTLEALSGVQLPRGTGIVTRCALELRLKRSDVKDCWNGNIRYRTKDGDLVNKQLQNGQQVGEEVHAAQEEMTHGDRGINEEDLITLDIESADVPDLTLIDLPGIARVAVGGQPSNIGTQIKRLIRKYIERQQTIILAVIPCNVDIATTEALSMAEEMDSKKERTLGVLTKPDLIDKGAEGEILKILRNEAYPLDKGYTMVKCRGQLNIESNQSLAEAMVEEEDFFRDHKIFSDLPSMQVGIKSLSHKLTGELVEQIKRSVPRLKDEVQKKLEYNNDQLKRMGKQPPITKRERTTASLDMVRGFMDDLKNISRGEYSYVKIKEGSKQALRLRTYSRQLFSEYGDTVKTFMPASSNKSLRQELKNKLSDERGREMRNFIKYSIFEEFAKDFVSKAKRPAEMLLKRIIKEHNTLIELLSNHYFSSFSTYKSEMKGIVYKYMKDIAGQLGKDIENLFGMEMHIFSQDQPYLFTLDEVTKDRLGKEEQANTDKLEVISISSVPRTSASKSDGKSPEDTETDILLDSLQSYFKVASSRVSDYVPMLIIHTLFSNCLENLETMLTTKCVDEDIINLVREDVNRHMRRLDLNETVKRLEIADEELAKF